MQSPMLTVNAPLALPAFGDIEPGRVLAIDDLFAVVSDIVVDRSEGASVFRRLERADLEHWLTGYSLGQLVRKNVIETGQPPC